MCSFSGIMGAFGHISSIMDDLVFECVSACEYTKLMKKIPKNMRLYVKDTIFREYDIRVGLRMSLLLGRHIP